MKQAAMFELYLWLGISLAINIVLSIVLVYMLAENLMKKSDKDLAMMDRLIKLSKNIELLKESNPRLSQNQPET